MQSAIRSFRADTYREQLALCEQIRVALARNFNNPALTDTERVAIGHRCNAALNESNTIRLVLALIDKKDREEDQGRATR
jgi:hypothetical protein